MHLGYCLVVLGIESGVPTCNAYARPFEPALPVFACTSAVLTKAHTSVVLDHIMWQHWGPKLTFLLPGHSQQP